jgi:hypothetical protein
MARKAMFVILLALVAGVSAVWAQSLKFPAVGSLDCNGLSKIQKPLRAHDSCADFINPSDRTRGEDNGVYIGHDEPSIGFNSIVPGSGNNMQWELTLPRERPLPATQSFENFITFWFSLALCDPGSFPNGPCIPDSDLNDPNKAGSAFLEMQFYPPGFSPFITQISCDLKHWCASLHINSLEVLNNGNLNPNCPETTNFAFIQRNGVPTGPAGPVSATDASFTPNNETLLMNQGDHLRVTIKDTPNGLMTRIEDLTTGQSGFMVASAKNGYQSLDPNTCAPTNFDFHPEFSTAKVGNYVPWAALQANVNISWEIGHFTPGVNGDNDADDPPCFPGPTLPGCLDFAQGGDIDFDGSSYVRDWPDGTRHNAPSAVIGSERSIGPLSARPDHNGNGRDGKDGNGGSDNYDVPYPQVQFETEVAASETTCTPTGAGCVVPPVGAAFYPFYSITGNGHGHGDNGDCRLEFGNLTGRGFDDFGGTAQYGTPNLAWFFATLSSGIIPNPCFKED